MKKLIIAAAMVCTLCIPAIATPVSASVAIGYTPSGLATAQIIQKVSTESTNADLSAMMKKIGYMAFIRH